ncbi:PIN domain-containing protein [Burkholderia cenocepacia]|uniref:PIN domain-containing protein n=1 Tax=Burkholderia cenocepacia TaxID=95486 RepID=UPI00196A4F51|nr:PIN domain-containing protein [Burkholderia cenocepacia]MBN3506414.1 DUF4935 domain-containing protein [Burkholderia cenocepacia]
MDPRIHELIEQKLIGAIALDTSSFDAQQRRLEDGLLRRVEQFGFAKNVQVLMPDIVQRELLAHLTGDAAAARTVLLNATRAPALAGLLPSVTLTHLQAHAAQAAEPRDAATARLTRWLDRTKATVLDVAANVDLRMLFDRYFSAQPPFSEAGKKKHEFPDAAALLALEHWAEARSTGVLVVSNDGDWRRFCAESKWLHCTAELGDALGAFQDETARFAARRLAELSTLGGPLDLAAALLDALRAARNAIRVQVDAQCIFAFTSREVITLQRVELPGPELAVTTFEPVDYNEQSVTVAVEATAHGRIQIHCAFGVWAGEDADRRYHELGTKSFSTMAAVPIRALVTLTGKIPARMEIGAVEILPTIYPVQVGPIVPDWVAPLGDNMTPPHPLG